MYQQTTSVWAVFAVFSILITLVFICICSMFRIQQHRRYRINSVIEQRPKRGFHRQLPQEIIQRQAPILARPSTLMILRQHDFGGIFSV